MSRENEKHLFQHVSAQKRASLTMTVAAPIIKKLNMRSIGSQVGFQFEEKQEPFRFYFSLILSYIATTGQFIFIGLLVDCNVGVRVRVSVSFHVLVKFLIVRRMHSMLVEQCQKLLKSTWNKNLQCTFF